MTSEKVLKYLSPASHEKRRQGFEFQGTKFASSTFPTQTPNLFRKLGTLDLKQESFPRELKPLNLEPRNSSWVKNGRGAGILYEQQTHNKSWAEGIPGLPLSSIGCMVTET